MKQIKCPACGAETKPRALPRQAGRYKIMVCVNPNCEFEFVSRPDDKYKEKQG